MRARRGDRPEVVEQSLTDPVPTLADLVSPLAFVLTGVGLS